jgi:hypothetical protein
MAIALGKLLKTKITHKQLRDHLVKCGFLTVLRTSGKNRYKLSKLGAGYAVSGIATQRYWHIALIKILEQSLDTVPR